MLISRLGYIGLNVDDLDDAVRLFETAGQLQLNRRDEGRAWLGAAGRHHWVVLQQDLDRPTGLTRMAFEIDPGVTLDDAEKVLAEAGVVCERRADFRTDLVRECVRFTDLDGTEIEIFRGLAGVAGGGAPKWARLERLLHVAVTSPNFDLALDFYTQVMGLGVSDFIEDTTAFLHASDGAHHSLVLQRRPGQSRAANHVCFQAESFDDVMRARAIVRREGYELRDDLIRHETSGSIGFYFEGLPRGLGVEFCYEHGQVDPQHHKPRVFVRTLQAKDVYEPPPGY
ncbi:VOC family protein [Nocardia jiangxiensis]|uniref:VOC family protein n=1 Tax=Nocardia jiangxiensis TaxID=282685 RepID=A0ABW6SF74_9NOCA|nr:VOC family protein [Nocardia jiangxiensis]